jgi:hypothetical protein
MGQNNVDTSTRNVYVLMVWIYLILLLIEGALRRWVLPSLAIPLLVIRDPIVIWFIFVAIRKGWIKNFYAVAMMILSTISLITTLIFSHQNLYTAIFGWRMYFFYFPFIFVIGHVLRYQDVIKIGRFLLYMSIPMTVLIIVQFYSPQSALVNRGVGGAAEGAGFSGALGYFRPPGIFSFTSVYAYFQLIVSCFIFFFLLTKSSGSLKHNLPNWLLYTALIAFLITIPYSISRTIFFQSIVVALFFIIAVVIASRNSSQIIGIFFVLFIVCTLLLGSNILGDSIEVFTARLSNASGSEGGMSGTLLDRYLGSIIRGIDNEFPFWGYGLGFGTNVGAKFLGLDNMYTKFNSDQEWVRVVGESGLLIGISIMLIRMAFSIDIFIKSFHRLRDRKTALPWIISPAILMLIMMGQFNANSNLGFAVFVAGIGVAALKPTN